MTLFDGPRDVMDHIKEFESRLNPTGYDHPEGEMTGWRAERQLVRIRESETEKRVVESKLDLTAWLLERISALMHIVRQAN